MGCRRKNISMLKFGFWRERRRPHTHARLFVDVAVARKTSGAKFPIIGAKEANKVQTADLL